MDKKIEINVRSLIIAAAIAVGAYLVYTLRGVILLILIAYLISAAVTPLVAFFTKRLGQRRSPAIMAAYVSILVFIFALGSLVIPPLISEGTHFFSKFPEYSDAVARDLNIDTSVINSNLEQVGTDALRALVSVVSNVIEFVTVFVLSIYITFERPKFKEYLIKLFGEERGERTEKIFSKIESRLGLWVRGQAFVCATIGLATYIGLTLLRLPYALPLGVIGAVLEIVPNIGPILSAIPAVIIGLSISPLAALAAGALYFLIHQSENYLVVPRLMGQAVGLSPLAVIIVLLVGGSLMGGLGVILAIPLFLALQTVIEEVVKKT